MTNKKESFYSAAQIEETLLAKTTRELEVLKMEIADALHNPGRLRYLVDFEQRELAYNPRKMRSSMEIKNEWGWRERVRGGETYFREIEQLPMWFVLRGSASVVFTDEWVCAIEERRHYRLLRRIGRYRTSGLLREMGTACMHAIDGSNGQICHSKAKSSHYRTSDCDYGQPSNYGRIQSPVRDDHRGQPSNCDRDQPSNCDDSGQLSIHDSNGQPSISTANTAISTVSTASTFTDTHKKEIARTLAHEAKAFVDTHTLYEDDEIRILNFHRTYVYHKPKEKERPRSTTRNEKVLAMMVSSNSKTSFKIPNIKKKGTCHSSHAAAFAKIPYELGQMSTPIDILRYKAGVRKV